MSDDKKIVDGGPAFPVPLDQFKDAMASGMSLRQWYAGMALEGLLANSVLAGSMGMATKDVNQAIEAYAKWAYQQADAMIEAGKK